MTKTAYRFPKMVVAASLATALVLGPMGAAPARADPNAAGALAFAGVIGLVLGGIVASQAQSAPRGHVIVTQPHPRHGSLPKPQPRHDRVLPAQCKFPVFHGPDRGEYIDRACLQRNFPDWTFLPMRCEVDVKRPGQRAQIAYKTECLARYGYRSDADVAGVFRQSR